jgi:hypothetical protein
MACVESPWTAWGLRNTTGTQTLRTVGFTRERERADVDIPRARTWTAYSIPGVAEVKVNMERAHTSAGYITEERTDGIEYSQQNETPIHRKTLD